MDSYCPGVLGTSSFPRCPVLAWVPTVGIILVSHGVCGGWISSRPGQTGQRTVVYGRGNTDEQVVGVPRSVCVPLFLTSFFVLRQRCQSVWAGTAYTVLWRWDRLLLSIASPHECRCSWVGLSCLGCWTISDCLDVPWCVCSITRKRGCGSAPRLSSIYLNADNVRGCNVEGDSWPALVLPGSPTPSPHSLIELSCPQK